MLVGIIGWVLVGLLVGFIISKVLDLHGDDPRLGIGVAAGVSAFNIWSLLFAAVGAGVAVAVWHMIRSKYVSRAPYTRRSSY